MRNIEVTRYRYQLMQRFNLRNENKNSVKQKAEGGTVWGLIFI